MGPYSLSLRFLVVGVGMTVVGAGLLTEGRGGVNDDVAAVGWPLVIAGPAVAVLGVALRPRPDRPRGGGTGRPPDGPYTAADFPPDVRATVPPGHFRTAVTAPGGDPPSLLVRYGVEEHAPYSTGPRSWPRDLGRELRHAFRASPGAEPGEPAHAGTEV